MKWNIYELPVLAFIGDKASLLIGEINTVPPLRRNPYDHMCPPYLAKIGASFTLRYRDSIVSLLWPRTDLLNLPTEEPSQGQISLDRWESYSRGVAYPLGWSGPYPERHDISVMSKALRDHEQSLDSCPFFGLISERSDPEGSVITQLHPFSPLRRAGVRERDVVDSVENESRKDLPPQSLEDAMLAARSGDRLVIRRHRREPLSLRLLSFREALQGAAFCKEIERATREQLHPPPEPLPPADLEGVVARLKQAFGIRREPVERAEGAAEGEG